MEPNFREGDFIIINTLAYMLSLPKKGDEVVISLEGRFLLKRINAIKNNKYSVIGDNKRASKDSRSFGLIRKNQITGKMLLHIKKD